MNAGNVIAQLQKQYPGNSLVPYRKIIQPKFFVRSNHQRTIRRYSVAISVVDKSAVHVHKKSTETYKVLSGILTLTKNGKPFVLHAGDSLIIFPGEIHFAEGNETWIECTSKPGWTPDDHILVQ